MFKVNSSEEKSTQIPRIHFIPHLPKSPATDFWTNLGDHRMLGLLSPTFVRVPPLKLDNQPTRAGDKPNVFTRSWRRVKKQYATKGWNFIPGVPWLHTVNQWYNPCLSSIVQSFPRNKRCLVPPKHPITGAVTSHNPQRPCPVAQISCPGLKVARCWWPWRMLQMEIVKAFKHKSILNK